MYLNPEKDPGLRKHAVLIEYPAEKKVMIGFEDMSKKKIQNVIMTLMTLCSIVLLQIRHMNYPVSFFNPPSIIFAVKIC